MAALPSSLKHFPTESLFLPQRFRKSWRKGLLNQGLSALL